MDPTGSQASLHLGSRLHRLGLALLLSLSLPTHAATVNDFDLPGAGFAVLQLDQPPPPELVAGPTGQQMRLAAGDGALPVHNTLAFERTDPGPFCGGTAEFDFTITPAPGRSHGLGFALLDTALAFPQGAVGVESPSLAAEEPNFARSIGVGFDTAEDAELEDPDANHVSLHWNGKRLTQVSAGALDLASGARIHALVEWQGSPGPAVSVTLTPEGGAAVTLIDSFPVPELSPYEARAWFGARSGGNGADFDLDNVAVSSTTCPPSQVGAWSSSSAWPVVAIHSHLLPDGRVLFWDRSDGGLDGNPRFFNPETGSVTAAPLAPPGHDLFCSGHVDLPDGRLFVAGGHVINGVGLPDAAIFDPVTNTWTSLPPMNAGRWYPTAALLANGDVFVASGRINPDVGRNRIPQVWQQASGSWRDLTGAAKTLPLYPFLFLAPDGRVFMAGPAQETGFFNPQGLGSYTLLGMSQGPHREYGSAVLYDEGKVMIAGGGDPPVDSVEVIDLGETSPTWRTVAPMAYRRRHHNLTLLPDESVLVSGGSGLPGFDSFPGASFPAEVWNPATETWTTVAASNEARLYHSEALLLPDGRVVVAGGGHPNGGAGDSDHYSAEIYSPPYLFKGPRPVLDTAPATVRYGEAFSVTTPDGASIQKVTWLRLASVTHSLNMSQRGNRLAFTSSVGGLTVTAPTDPRRAPPGNYLLFLLNTHGVPSVGRVVRLVPDLFADGFETGDTSAWSLTVGP